MSQHVLTVVIYETECEQLQEGMLSGWQDYRYIFPCFVVPTGFSHG